MQQLEQSKLDTDNVFNNFYAFFFGCLYFKEELPSPTNLLSSEVMCSLQTAEDQKTYFTVNLVNTNPWNEAHSKLTSHSTPEALVRETLDMLQILVFKPTALQ